jgi:hypothetical protein
VTERADLDADDLMWGPPPKPPPEVAADPIRLDLWNKQHQHTPSGHVVYQAAGCDHEVFYSCGRSKKNHPMCAATEYHTPTTKKKSLPTLTTLASASLEGQWNAIDAPPFVGDQQSFDVDANFDWASTIATAWSSDAKLYNIRIGHPSTNGTVDISAKGFGDVLYEFNSAAKGDMDFTVDVSSLRGQRNPPFAVNRSKHADNTPRNPITKPKCTLVSAVAKARAGVLAKVDPKYGLDFTLESNGQKTTWTTSAVIGDKSQWVRIDSATCEIAK